MKKILLVCVLVMISNAYFIKPSFARKFVKYGEHSLIKVNRNIISKSTNIKRLINNINLKKYTQVDKMALIATKLSEKSSVAKSMLNSKYPLVVIKNYAKHGDEFLQVSKQILHPIKLDGKILSKFPKLRNLNKDEAQNLFLKRLKYGGKKAYEISKKIALFSTKHSTSVIAGVLTAWFLTDPDGFLTKLQEVGGNIEKLAEIIGKTVGKSVGKLVNNSVREVVSNIFNPTVLFGIGGFLLIFILWKFRDLLFRFIRIKVESKLDNLEQQNNRKGPRL